MSNAIEVNYKNHRGEIRKRLIIPKTIHFGVTKHHPKPQWLLLCWDLEKKAMRDYALADCDFRMIGDRVNRIIDENPETPWKAIRDIYTEVAK